MDQAPRAVQRFAGRAPLALVIALVASLVAVAAPPPRPAGASPADVPSETWVTNGRVKTMIRGGNRLYLGGYFTQVGPNTGHGVAVDGVTGLRNAAFPKIDGTVYAAVADGSGGWYVVGDFSAVGDAFRKNAAQITATGAVTNWNPRVDGGPAYAVAYAPASGQVYLGGDFTAVGTIARSRLAAVAATGAGDLVTGWNPGAGAAVRALVLRGGDVLIGGDFTTVAGVTRSRLAALDPATGAARAWNPGASAAVRVLAVPASLTSTIVYAGGDFTTAGGAARSRLVALDATTGAATAWDPGASAAVRALALTPDGATVYAGGDFTTAGGAARVALAALDAASGAAGSWTGNVAGCNRATPEEPACIPAVHALSLSSDGTTLSVGGLFTSAGGAARNQAAALNTATGLATPWDPSPNTFVRTLAPSGTQILVGGDLTSVNAPTRNRVAALDATTGALDPGFAADANDYVEALALSPDGTRLFLGGDFNKVDGKGRTNLAAVDAATGALDGTWNPIAKGGPVMAMLVSGGRLYLGGKFVTVAGVDVPRLAAVDPVSGAVVTGWRPAPDSWVAALVPSPTGTLLYAGGDFAIIGGRSQARIAAISTATGTASSWVPWVAYPVLTMVVSPDGSRLYTGGMGYNLTGNRASAFNTALSGRPVWETRGDGNVQGLGLSPAGDILYIGGHFAYQNGVPRQHMAAVRSADGVLTPFAPNVNGALGVWFLAMDSGNLYIGGDFTLVAGRLQQGFARFPAQGPTLAITAGPADGTSSTVTTATWSGTATAATGGIVARIEASIDGGAFGTGGVTCTGCGATSATWTFTTPAPLAAGPHTFDFRGVDGVGDSAAPLRRTYTVDLSPPALDVTGGLADGGTGNDATPTYTGTAGDTAAVARIEAAVDGGAFATAGVSCTGCGTGAATWSWTAPTALADGPHSLAFRAVDGAGFTSPLTTRSLTIDTVVPVYLSLTAPGGALLATFSEGLACSSVARADFSALVNGASRTVKTVTCTGTADSGIEVTLGSGGVHSGDAVALTLKAPVADVAGNTAPRPTTWSVVIP